MKYFLSICALIFVATLIVYLLTQKSNNAIAGDTPQSKLENMIKDFDDKFSTPELTASELQKQLDANNIVIVDVREAKEIQISKIKNSLTLAEFESRKDSFKNKRIIVYCTIGYRSSITSDELRTQGFDSYNLRGGVLSWAHAKGDFVDPKGKPTNDVHVYGKQWSLLPEGYTPKY